MIFKGPLNEYLLIKEINSNGCYLQNETFENSLTFLWFDKESNFISVDGVDYTFHKNQIVCLTELHKIDITKVNNAKMIRFNRSFYCIIDHDKEVGCKGILFFGASQLPIIKISEEELEKFQIIWRMLEIELESNDHLQLEMLQSMIKRFVILCTRIYKNQENYSKIEHHSVDIIREFNFLVENHFKTKHTVAEYADLLNKSPKTLSNLFSKLSSKPPLQYIQDRKMLEAKRLLKYTDKSIKEVAFEIGFEDIQTFSRFFKNYQGISPTDFKVK